MRLFCAWRDAPRLAIVWLVESSHRQQTADRSVTPVTKCARVQNVSGFFLTSDQLFVTVNPCCGALDEVSYYVNIYRRPITFRITVNLFLL
jgi:hypothetical protein